MNRLERVTTYRELDQLLLDVMSGAVDVSELKKALRFSRDKARSEKFIVHELNNEEIETMTFIKDKVAL